MDKRHCSLCDEEFDGAGDFNFCNRDGGRLVKRVGYWGRTVAGRYFLAGLIGEGGYGEVYVGRVQQPPPDSGLSAGSVVAVKLLTRRKNTIEEWEKLKSSQKREILIAQKIRHENLLRIYDSGIDAGTDSLYVVMPLGRRDLKTILKDEGPRSRSFDPERWYARVCDMGLQICSALTALHAQDIFHRDVSPQNAMEADGAIKLIDYGIAKDLHESSITQTQTGAVKGNVDFMCPDYFRNDGRVDDWAQVDQYSFGIVMFQLFTGSLPFKARDSLMMIKHHCETAPPRLRDVAGSLPEDCEEFVQRLIKKRPEERYPDMRAVREALAAIAPGGKPKPGPKPQPAPEGVIEILGVEQKDGKYILRF